MDPMTFDQVVGWILGNSWRLPAAFSVNAWLLTPAALIMGAAIVLEQLFPFERQTLDRSNADTLAYLVFGAKLSVFTLILAPLLQTAWERLGLPSLQLSDRLPTALAAVAGLVTISFGDYWAHRWLHQVGWLWHIHKIHHAPAKLHWATRYHAHFAMQIIHVPIVGTLTMLMGTKMMAPFGALMILIDFFAHANIGLRFGWLNYVLVTPEIHRYHHSTNPQHHNTNFSNSLPLWDVIFGTFHYDPRRPATEFGLPEVPAGFLAQQVHPLRWIAADAKAVWTNLTNRRQAAHRD